MDFDGNNLLHIAAMNSNTRALDFILKNITAINPHDRNKKGETALTISQDLKNEDAIKILQKLSSSDVTL